MNTRGEHGMVRTRFAPSPTGFMHVGNLRTALYEYLIAKSQNGKFILRIEDTDRERLVEGAVDVIYRTLDQVGLQHDEGPDVGGDFGPYIQSERKGLYREYAEKLVSMGKAYYCFCTKERLDSLHSEDAFGGYDRHCRNLSFEEAQARKAAGEPYVIRQKMPTEGATAFHDAVYGDISIENCELEDQILLKSDGYPTYNFANVVDDHLMQITHVVRGCEYLTSTPKYKLLYEAFGWEIPVYVHLPMIMGRNADGTVSKLSKRHGSTGFADLVADGYLPEAIVNYIALLGWCPKEENREIFTLAELASVFSIDGISKSPAVFDYDKLTWMNGEYLRAMQPEDFTAKAMPQYRKVFADKAVDWEVLTSILQPRVTKLEDIPEMIGFLRTLPEYPAAFFINKKSKTNLENAGTMLTAAIAELETLQTWSVEAIHDVLLALAQRLEVKNGTLLWPVRIAAAGMQVTPGGAMEILAILGKEESLQRLRAGLEKLSGAAS